MNDGEYLGLYKSISRPYHPSVNPDDPHIWMVPE